MIGRRYHVRCAAARVLAALFTRQVRAQGVRRAARGYDYQLTVAYLEHGEPGPAAMPPKARTMAAIALVCAVFSMVQASAEAHDRVAPHAPRRSLLGFAQTRQERAGLISGVRVSSKVVALTLDDGPDAKYTPRVLRLARERGVKLTFFLVGAEIRLHPEIARREVAEGHALGNHTWDHETMDSRSQQWDIGEIERCEDEIERVCGERTHLLRPPKGRYDAQLLRAARALGYRVILWSVALEHHSARTPEEMAKRVISRVRPGMIILAHDGEPGHAINRETTMRALPILIEGLQRKGYRFVTVPQLLRLRNASG